MTRSSLIAEALVCSRRADPTAMRHAHTIVQAQLEPKSACDAGDQAENLARAAARGAASGGGAPGGGPPARCRAEQSGCSAVAVVAIAVLALAALAALLGLDRQGGHRPGLQPLDADLFAGLQAVAVGAVLDALERFVDLADQLALAVAGAQFQAEFLFLGGAVVRDRESWRPRPSCARPCDRLPPSDRASS